MPEIPNPLNLEIVVRRPPVGLDTQDALLFSHEYSKSFQPTVPRVVDCDFLPQGLLLAPRKSKPLDLGFQSGVPKGIVGLKVRIKGLIAKFSFPRVAWTPATGRQFLIITDEFSNGYFHWLADGLPKLAWLGSRLVDYELILPAFTRRFPYMEQSLKLWPELKYRIVDEGVRVGLENVLVIPALAPTGNYRPELMKVLGDSWRTRVRAGEIRRRVFISRAKAPWRKLYNEAEVWQVLEPLGFEKVSLEDFSFEDQVRLMAETRVLVTNHGAGLTNMLFMPPGGTVLEIRLRGDGANNCYFSLASAVDLEYRYLLADPAPGKVDSHTTDLVVDPAALRRTLEALS